MMECPWCGVALEIAKGGIPESGYVKAHEADGKVCPASWGPAK